MRTLYKSHVHWCTFMLGLTYGWFFKNTGWWLMIVTLVIYGAIVVLGGVTVKKEES